MRKFQYIFSVILTTVAYFSTHPISSVTLASEGLPVFPGAEGFGTTTRAAYGLVGTSPIVYRVTNLNASGPGSLKYGIEHSGPRVIVFEVSGTIDISSLGAWGLMIKNPYITIAGQTAPSPGVTLRGATFIIETHDVLIQHLRFRPGDTEGSGCAVGPENCDAIAIVDLREETDVYNVVIDHCSLSWSIDEALSLWYSGVHNVTVRNCIISEALNESLHPKGKHGYGPLVGYDIKNVSLIGNLFAHNAQRNPLLSDKTETVILNNLIYNYNIATHAAAFDMKASIVGNVFIKGFDSGNIQPIYLYEAQDSAAVYVLDNEAEGKTEDPWSVVRIRPPSDIKASSPPVWVSPLTVKPSNEVTEWVLTNAGARPVDRDSVDLRIVNDVRNRTGRLIDSQSDVGGWPNLAENYRTLEIPSSPNDDDDADGYRNLEEWLHTFAAKVEGRGGPLSAPKGLRALH